MKTTLTLTPAQQATVAEIAKALQTTEGNAIKRAHAMKLTPVCTRCGGCGNFSFNQINGTTCFGCNGNGHTAPKAKDLAGVLERAHEAAADGTLDGYLAAMAARNRAKRARELLFAAWNATHAARALSGWGSHMFQPAENAKHPEYAAPGNFAEVREANRRMHNAVTEALNACTLAEVAKATDPERDTKALQASRAVDAALQEIKAADTTPDAALTAFVQGKQRESAERVRARGFAPGFSVYGEG